MPDQSSKRRIFMDKILTYTITSQEAGMQVLEFLRSKGFSRHILTSMKPDKEALLVNGVRAGGRSILKEGDFFRVRVMETATTEGIVPASLPLNILYEDEDILVLNKPSDMLSILPLEIIPTRSPMPLLFISRKEENSVPSAASTVWTVTPPEPWFLPRMLSVPRFSLHRCVTERSGALTWLWSAVLLHRPEPSQLPSVVSRIP